MFVELSRYVNAELGKGGWERVLDRAGLGVRSYSPSSPGLDDELTLLTEATAGILDRSHQAVLVDFGRFLAPELLSLYRSLIDPQWRLLDLLEHTESTIHTVIRIRELAADPPRLQIERRSQDEVMILYTSPRKLCSLAKGIIRGAAEHYGERVDLVEMACMLQGDERCEIVVRRRDV